MVKARLIKKTESIINKRWRLWFENSTPDNKRITKRFNKWRFWAIRLDILNGKVTLKEIKKIERKNTNA